MYMCRAHSKPLVMYVVLGTAKLSYTVFGQKSPLTGCYCELCIKGGTVVLFVAASAVSNQIQCSSCN